MQLTLTLSNKQTDFDASIGDNSWTFENILAKGEIAYNKQFLLFAEIFHILTELNKSSDADLTYVGKD